MAEDAAKIVGYYSIDGDRTFLPDSSQLLYFNPPKETEVHLDLDEGIESAVHRDAKFEEEGIDLLLEWLKWNHKKLRANSAEGRLLQPKFICTRGTLSSILKTPFTKEPWTIYAAKWKGNVYLCTDRSTKSYPDSAKNDKCASWGQKFQQYVFSASPDQPPDTSKPVVESAEFRCVFLRHIGNHSVLFCAAMKGLCSETALKHPLPLKKLKFIELKTNVIIENFGQERTLRKNKFLRWWSPQSYPTDTEEVLCGFRDRSGVVQKLRRYNIGEIVAMAKDYWDPKTCVEFCQSFLTKISDTVINECDESLYRFENIPNEGINVTNLSSENQCTFIPESFMEALE